MALADYFHRVALAAAQVIAGFDEKAFRQALESTTVGIAVGSDASDSTEGRALADMLIRLVARLYPRIQLIVGDPGHQYELAELAHAINPYVDLVDEAARVGISVGELSARFPTTIVAGSSGWLARVGFLSPGQVGSTTNPFGAGVAACLASANLFRYVFLGQSNDVLDSDISFSAFTGERDDSGAAPALPERVQLRGETVLVGLGAIGHGTLWALARAPLDGAIHLVDPEVVELSNLQRYVCASRPDVGRTKVAIAESVLAPSRLRPIGEPSMWQQFVARDGYRWSAVLSAVDSAAARRAAQAALPRWIANAWTQPGDLGISVHGPFGDGGACVSCLYLPAGPVPNEDELVARALNVPERQLEIRELLYKGTSVSAELLEAVAQGLSVPHGSLTRFEGATVRELYVEGLCGGAVIGLDRVGSPPQELHVPLAHQSALAGILLASSLVRHALRDEPPSSEVTRIDILRPLGVHLRQPVRSADARCICQDRDYVTAFRDKWGITPSAADRTDVPESLGGDED